MLYPAINENQQNAQTNRYTGCVTAKKAEICDDKASSLINLKQRLRHKLAGQEEISTLSDKHDDT